MCEKNRKTYLWLEDREGKSSVTFWKILMQQLAPEMIVEGKKNCSELAKAVKQLQDKENRYIILFDNSFDNVQVYQEQKRLKKCVEMKDNVEMLGIICFEYILLEFDELLDWIYASEDIFWIKRAVAISARKKLLSVLQAGSIDYKLFREIVAFDKNLKEHNIEQLSAKLLFELTRNTGFEVTKKSIGKCWIVSCCGWIEKQNDDICGLDRKKLSLRDKMRRIYNGTSLYREFSEIGLEVLQ